MVPSDALIHRHALRRGCSHDQRQVYRKIKDSVPEDMEDLRKEAIRNELWDPEEVFQRKRLADYTRDEEEPKRRRKYPVKVETNKHLEGTEIGALILEAFANGTYM